MTDAPRPTLRGYCVSYRIKGRWHYAIFPGFNEDDALERARKRYPYAGEVRLGYSRGTRPPAMLDRAKRSQKDAAKD